MSHVNTTPHYGLPIYGENDIINPLTDFNDANSAIDTALYEIADAQGSEASSISDINTFLGDKELDTVAQDVTDAINEVNTAVGNADTAIGNVASDVVALQTAVGNSSTGIIHDVSELQTAVGSQGNSITALQNTVGDANSGLVKAVADNTAAIANIGENVLGSVTADGVKTASVLLGELWTAMQAKYSQRSNFMKVKFGDDLYDVTEATSGVVIAQLAYIVNRQDVSKYVLYHRDIRISTTPSWEELLCWDDNTINHSDKGSSVPTSGTVIQVIAL